MMAAAAIRTYPALFKPVHLGRHRMLWISSGTNFPLCTTPLHRRLVLYAYGLQLSCISGFARTTAYILDMTRDEQPFIPELKRTYPKLTVLFNQILRQPDGRGCSFAAGSFKKEPPNQNKEMRLLPCSSSPSSSSVPASAAR